MKPRLAYCFFLLLGLFAGHSNAHAQIISTIAGTGIYGFSGDGGPATNAQLFGPRNVTFDKYGNLYFVDGGNYRIRKINKAGIITTVAGNGTNAFAGDGGAATSASIENIYGLGIDTFGALYILQGDNNRVRKVSTTGIITTIAGTGALGHVYSGDGGPATAASIADCERLTVDKKGNIYLVATALHKILKINSAGIISTIAGTGSIGFSGDGGPATNARIYVPIEVAADNKGNIFISDGYNNRIRKIDTLGIISTVAGSSLVGYSGDGGPATAAALLYPISIAVDDSNNLYIWGDSQPIRKVNSTGIISTIAANGIDGYSGDGGPATAAEVSRVPEGLAIDKAGNIYIGDMDNQRIRMVYYRPVVNYVPTVNKLDIKVFPNPAGSIINISASKNVQKVSICDISGHEVLSNSYNSADISIDIRSLVSGVYTVTIDDLYAGKVVKE